MEKFSLTCGYCSTGCNLLVQINADGTTRVSANPTYPVNLGKACPKGFQLLGHLSSPDRAKTPLLRNAAGTFDPISWDDALSTFVVRFKALLGKYGKESAAFIGTGQITNEEHALLGSLAKFGMGFIHGDGNTRQCMASSVVAYKQSFGWDAPPFTYKDFQESDVLIFMGSNPVIAHPIMWMSHVRANKNNPTIVVIDPRKTETASASETTHHYQIRNKSELPFLYALSNLLIQNGWIDEAYIAAHTEGFEAFKAHVDGFTPESTAESTGINPEELLRLAEIIHKGKSVSFWWMVGVNQMHQATRTAQALINLALMTGNIGRPGTGANSITGQCNAMGSRMFSNTTALLAGRDFEKETDRADLAEILKIDVNTVPPVGSFSYEKILEAVIAGKIKGLWIVCTNPAHSWINSNFIDEVRRNLEFLVVQDLFHSTETARIADLILPAAGAGEKSGTFINSERRIGVLQPILPAPGEALPDFEIFKKIADAWGCGAMFEKWTDPEATLMLIKELTRGTPWDITGLKSYRQIIDNGGIQWPYPEGSPENPEPYRRLFSDGRFHHPSGKAKFLFEDVKPLPEPITSDFPFVLITGRGSVSAWHTTTRTGKVPILAKSIPADVYVEINEEDARRLGISHNDWVVVSSRRDTIEARAAVGSKTQPGEAFMSMHYPETNKLTHPSFDDYSRQPGYKFSAIQIKPLLDQQ